jgi:seryl-tRNA synthetase
MGTGLPRYEAAMSINWRTEAAAHGKTKKGDAGIE